MKQTLYFGNPCHLSVANDQLRIAIPAPSDNPGAAGTVTTRPLEDIGIMVIDTPRATMTASVFSGLMKYGAALIVCDSRHLPSGLMLNLEGHSSQSERFRTHLTATLPLKKQLWQQTVSAKIHNQAMALRQLNLDQALNMLAWEKKVRSGDPDNFEATAAVYYWKTYLASFPGVTRRRDGDEPNSMLNYGYAILRAIIARALVAAGMHPTLGIHHRNKYNPYCLADDIMEPYRPYVDIIVASIVRDNPDATIADKGVKRQLLSIPVCDVRIGNLRRPLSTAAAETAASLFKCFAGETRKIHYPAL